MSWQPHSSSIKLLRDEVAASSGMSAPLGQNVWTPKPVVSLGSVMKPPGPMYGSQGTSCHDQGHKNHCQHHVAHRTLLRLEWRTSGSWAR